MMRFLVYCVFVAFLGLLPTGAAADAMFLTPKEKRALAPYMKGGILEDVDRRKPGRIETWHLLTVTYGGTISLIKDITKEECEFALHRVRGEPATEEEKAEAARAKEAHDARQRELDLRWDQWRKDHDCKPDDPKMGHMTFGGSGVSTKNTDGSCWRGDEFYADVHVWASQSWTIGNDGDRIKHAECFE